MRWAMRWPKVLVCGVAVVVSAGADEPQKAQPPAKKAAPADLTGFAEAAAADYLKEWAKVERKAKGMTEEHARRFKRTSYASLMSKLTRAYEVTERQVRAAVREREREITAKAADRAAAGTLPVASLVAVSLEAMEQADALVRTGNNAALRQMEVAGQSVRTTAPLSVRVLGVIDRRVYGLPDLARVLVLGGPDAGRERYCYPGRVVRGQAP